MSNISRINFRINNSKSLKTAFNIIFPMILVIIVLISIFFYLMIPKVETKLIDTKKEKIRDLTHSVTEMIHDYYKRYEQGEYTLEEAKRKATQRVKSLRYGLENKDYFWIHDVNVHMVMHPYMTELDGTDMSNFKDSSGKLLVVEMVEVAQEYGSGYVNYMWQWKDDRGKIVPKLSYVELFEPWGWIVGTGIYINDVDLEISELTYEMSKLFFIFFVFILIIGIIIIFFSVKTEKRKNEIEDQLRQNEKIFRRIFDNSVDFIALTDPEGKVVYANSTALDFIEVELEDMIGLYFWDTPWWHTSSKLKHQIKEIFDDVKAGIEVTYDLEHKSPSGKRICVDFSLQIIRDEDGNIDKFLAEGHDITSRKIAEATLRKNEERQRLIFDQSPVATQIHNTNGLLSHVNPTWQKLWKQKDIGNIKSEYNILEDEQALQNGLHAAFFKALNGEKSTVSEYLFDPEQSDIVGKPRWLKSKIYPLKNDHDDVHNIVIMHEDISMEVEAHKSIKASEIKYRTLFESANDGILIIKNGKYHDCNEKILDMLLLKRSDVIGQDLDAIYSDSISEQTVEEAILSKTSTFFEGKNIRYDGKVIFTETSISRIIIDEEVYGLAFVRDISLRKKAEKIFQDTVQKASVKVGHKFFDSMVMQMSKSLNADFTIIGEISAANSNNINTLAVCEQNKIVGNIEFPIRNSPSEHLLQKGIYILTDGVSKQYQDDFILHELEVESYVGVTLYDVNNTPIGVMSAYFKESTDNLVFASNLMKVFAGRVAAEIDRFRAEKKLIGFNKELEQIVEDRTKEISDKNRELNDFAHIVSHDLKAPLRGIAQLVQWFETDYKDKIGSEGSDLLDMLLSRVMRLDGMIEGILKYSVVSSSEISRVEIDMNEVVAEVIDSLVIPNHVSVDIQSNLPQIDGDRIRMVQLFQNIISNALKYTDRDKGRVWVTCADKTDHWEFVIGDNGLGISKKNHEKIFRIFQILESDSEESTGIGLFIVKKIIELIGGDIKINSELERGTEVVFSIPK